MKLLICLKCNDIFNLSFKAKKCHCGKTRGVYDKNGLDAVYTGEFAYPAGFSNPSLVKALKNQPQSGNGVEFKAFVIPKECPTFVKVDKEHPLLIPQKKKTNQ